MSFCSKCGAQIDDAGNFCPSCGAKVERPGQGADAQRSNPGFEETVRGLNDTPDTTAEYDQADIASNKWMAMLAYLGPLVFIPMFASKESRYAQYHVKQGVNMFVVWILNLIVCSLLSLIKVGRYIYIFGVPRYVEVTPWPISLITGLLTLVVVIFEIIGIVNALSGKAKQLPIIGGISIMK